MRILIVEDDAEISGFVKSGLEAEFFSVDVAEDGERGSYMARTNDYDLVILDNILPKKNGADVCAEIREHGKTMPILMLSIQSDVPRRIELLNRGADDYMSKPFSLGEVIARVRALLRRPQAMAEDRLCIDDLVLDTLACRVERAGKTVHLTRKEFELLEYLLRNKGKVMSRGAIMEHVWDISADPFSNTIETHILNLRRKIDRSGKRKLIHTVSGKGYRIDDKA